MFLKIIFPLIIIFTLFLTSCKKCLECECKKNGMSYTEKNCAYGGGTSNNSLDTWQLLLEEEYEEVNCTEVK
jgi:hypothetical protein